MKSYFLPLLCVLMALSPASKTLALEEADLKDGDGKVIVHYAVEAPKNIAPADTTDPDKQVGLFMCFHEHGGKAPDETHSVIESLERLKLSDRFVVLGMKDGTPHGYSFIEDHQRALKLIEWAKKTYPINPRRVVLWGRGEGAKFVGEFGQEHPEIPAAIITYSWGFKKFYEVPDPALNMPDFYIVLGLKDIPTHYKMVRETFALVKQHNFNVIYREVEGLAGPTRNAASNDDAILWAAACRHKTMALSKEEDDLLRNADKKESGVIDLETVGGRQAGAKVEKFLGSLSKFESTLAMLAQGRANLGPAGAESVVARISDPVATVRALAFKTLGVWANWRILPAQVALCEAAVDTKRDLKDRAWAIDALGVATKMQVKGSYQDVPLFKALITVLGDDDAELRVKAFEILSPIMPSDYRPYGSSEEREKALEKWTEWLEKSPKITPAPPLPTPAAKK